jgi:ribosomal protein L21E
MLKLKKIMGTGAVITALFAAPITVINQPTLALSQTVQSALIARGSTPVGNTAWQQYSDGESIFVDVDTSSAKFTATPMYITSLGGIGYHWATTGATSIYVPTPTGFRVYVRFARAEWAGSLTPAFANQNKWHINWIAVPQ